MTRRTPYALAALLAVLPLLALPARSQTASATASAPLTATRVPVVKASSDTPVALTPPLTAQVNVTTYSGSTAGATLVVTNNQPASRAAQVLPVTITLRDAAGKAVSATLQKFTIPALDSHWTGTVTLDIPLSLTVANLADGATSTIDDQGTHIVAPITALDGGGTWSTVFDLSGILNIPVPNPVLTATPGAAN